MSHKFKQMPFNKSYAIWTFREAREFLKEGKYEDAIEALDGAWRLTHGVLVRSLDRRKGLAYGLQGMHAEAVQAYEKAIEINPREATYWSNKGVCLFTKTNMSKPLRCLIKLSRSIRDI